MKMYRHIQISNPDFDILNSHPFVQHKVSKCNVGYELNWSQGCKKWLQSKKRQKAVKHEEQVYYNIIWEYVGQLSVKILWTILTWAAYPKEMKLRQFPRMKNMIPAYQKL